VEVEDKVELAYISKVFVQDLHEGLHQFEDDQLVLVLVHDCYEVEGSESFVDNFELLVIKEIAHFGASGDDHLVDLPYDLSTSFKIRCFSDWLRFIEYHLVSRDLPCLLIRKKQWIIVILNNNTLKNIKPSAILRNAASPSTLPPSWAC
jgi:hypothetical protein